MSSAIRSIHARHLIDCKLRGLVEVDVVTESGALGRAASPTGTSVGKCEAHVKRDAPPARFLGTSVYSAVETVNTVIAPALVGMDASDQRAVDNRLLELDGTPLKTKLGGNSIYSVSAACAAAAASSQKMPLYDYWAKMLDTPVATLPLPVSNMFNGGRYGDVEMAFQEFGVIPYGAADMQEAVEIIVEMFAEVGRIVTERQGGRPPGIANYFGHIPLSGDPIEHFAIMAEAADRLGHSGKICYSTDCAAGEFYDEKSGRYRFKGKMYSKDDLIDYISELTERFPFFNVEDILHDDDFEGFAEAAKKLTKTRLIGDDLVCTDARRLARAKELGSCEGFIFKPNQIGTISECIDTYRYALDNEMIVIPSVRAGGTLDDPVKEMSIVLDAPAAKCGAPRSGERVSFLQTLMRASDLFPNAGFKPIDLKKR